MPPPSLAVLGLLVALACLPATAAAGARVPRHWLGVTADGPMTPVPGGPLAPAVGDEWDRMARSGVGSVRASFRWEVLQPYAAPGDVPPASAGSYRTLDGVPTDFSVTDALVQAAAQRGLELLPVVEGTPGWARIDPRRYASPPRDPALVARVMRALVGRYGPDGAFWRERPDVPRRPIRAWQVYNEPNLPGFWRARPFAPSYVRVLRATSRAAHAADPGAVIVLAGLPTRGWDALRAIYAAGGRGAFDAVAVHPYTPRPRNVVRVIRLARRVMRAHGDARMPVWVTEFTWTAARHRLPDVPAFTTTDAGQAARLAAVLRRFAAVRRELRIARVYWYTWLSAEGPGSAFHWSGLRRVRAGARIDAPALAAFRREARRLAGPPRAAAARRVTPGRPR